MQHTGFDRFDRKNTRDPLPETLRRRHTEIFAKKLKRDIPPLIAKPRPHTTLLDKIRLARNLPLPQKHRLRTHLDPMIIAEKLIPFLLPKRESLPERIKKR